LRDPPAFAVVGEGVATEERALVFVERFLDEAPLRVVLVQICESVVEKTDERQNQ